MKQQYILTTIVISYLCKRTGKSNYSYVKVEDVFPCLVNTFNIMNYAKSNDRYEVLGIEYDYEKFNFQDIDSQVCNTIH